MSKFKKGSNSLRDWTNVFSLRNGKTLKQSIIDKKLDQKEADEKKLVPNLHLTKRNDFMKKTPFKLEDVFGDILKKVLYQKSNLLKLIFFQTNLCKYSFQYNYKVI